MKSLEERHAERAKRKLDQLNADLPPDRQLPEDFVFSGFTGPHGLGGIGYTGKVSHRGNGAGDAAVIAVTDESNANGRSVAAYGTPVASRWGEGWPNSDTLSNGSAD